MALISGAWVNPWYTGSSFHTPTTFPALASVADWSEFAPAYGFSSEKVEQVRASTGGKVLVSFGGAAAESIQLWQGMAADPSGSVERIDASLSSIGADGIDYNYMTALSPSTAESLAKVMQGIKDKDKYVQTMSVEAGTYGSVAPIIGADVLDYVTVMCYNGGMFTKDHPEGGLDWEGWMDSWVSNMPGKTNKLIVGCCIQYHEYVKYYADSALVDQVKSYCQAKGLAGAFFWWYSDDAPGAYTIGDLVAKFTPWA